MGRALGALACGFAVQHPQGYGAGYLDVLGMSWARGRDCGTRLRLQMGTAPIVKLSLETSGILEIFDVVHTRKEALSAW